ncbi:MAG: glycosyltransferase family 4 protein [Gallionellaceae bacterium]|nr:glycosyltransferase family 4 protein [Gallionellaceae bacterium]
MNTHKKYRILMVAACPFPANHGSAASIREMSEALVRLGHEVHVLTYPIKEDIPVMGVHIHRVHVPFMKPGKVKVGPGYEKFLYDPLMLIKSLHLIRKYNIDVIHAHNYEGALIGWFGKFLMRRPMLYNAVNSMADELPTYNFIKPRKLAVWLGRFLDSFVPHLGTYVTVVSDALKDFLLAQGVSQQRMRVVPAGVNLDMFARGNGAKVRLQHGLGSAPLVLYTGALDDFQRIDYLLKAMQRTLQLKPDAHLLIAGSVKNADAQQRYQAMAQALGITAHVTFVEVVPLTELADYLAAGDVTVVPRPECPGHPVKLLNYMAAGKATVSFKGGAKGLHHMYNGYLVDDHDHDHLGEGIAFLLEQPELRRTLAANARLTILGNFDWDTLAQGIAVLYQIMLEKRVDRVMQDALARYLRDGYVLEYTDKRNADSTALYGVCRRSSGRRKTQTFMRSLERRKVLFSGARPDSQHYPDVQVSGG